MSKPKSAKVDVEEGSYDMVVKTVADIGTQTVKKFQATDDDDTEEKKQVIIVFELVESSTKEKPVTLTKWATNNSSSKKAFGHKLMKAAGLDPKKADWDDLLNKAVIGTVEHTESGNAKITEVTPVKKGTKVARGFLPTSSVYLDATFDRESFEAMPEFIQNAIIKAPEFEEIDSKRSKGKDKKATPTKGKKK